LTKEYERIGKEKNPDNDELEFQKFFKSIIEIMEVVLATEESKLLPILKSYDKSKTIMNKLESLTYDETKNLFKPSHIFVYILQTALEGGSIYQNGKQFRLEPKENFTEFKKVNGSDSKNIINYITQLFQYDDSFFKNGIFYTAQFIGTATAGEAHQDWYGI
jgi:hypothetical protein